MTHATPASAAALGLGIPTAADGMQAAIDGSALFVQAFIDSQRLALQALLGWQQAMASLQQDAWDAWVSHFAGGVPIDG